MIDHATTYDELDAIEWNLDLWTEWWNQYLEMVPEGPSTIRDECEEQIALIDVTKQYCGIRRGKIEAMEAESKESKD